MYGSEKSQLFSQPYIVSKEIAASVLVYRHIYLSGMILIPLGGTFWGQAPKLAI
jgi:hypothetical protein